MKTVEASELTRDLDMYLSGLAQDAILVTRAGKPCAVLHFVAGDVEAAELAHSTEFWQMIEQRRHEQAVSWEDAKRELT